MGRRQMKVGTTIVKILNGISPIAAIAALAVVIGGYFEFRAMGKTLDDQTTAIETMAKKSDLDNLSLTVKENFSRQEQADKEIEARREALAKEIERDRKDYATQQREVDQEQNRVYEMFGANLNDVNGRVQAMQGKLDSVGGDVTIIKQLLMKRPGPSSE